MRIAAELIVGYTFNQPFHLWLQEIFRQNKQFGSKDRKFYRDVFYGYWRLGRFGLQLSVEQRLLAGLIRQGENSDLWNDIVSELFPGYNKTADFNDIQQFIGETWNPYKSLEESVSGQINYHKLNTWFGQKAPVWLKINPLRRKELLEFLQKKSVEYEEFESGTLKVSHDNLDEAILKGWCRIQDLGSQESLNTEILTDSVLIWDACCGAGGKSLLASDLNSAATLYISDSRSKMVHNALLRFSSEGKPLPFSANIDLSGSVRELIFDEKIKITKPVFDTIICDVPCSGSGTWRRNPEMLHAFTESEINTYSERQRNIVKNALPFLKQGGQLIYLTCSIFSEENENNARYLAEKKALTIISEKYCGGYNKDADFIYRAVFKK